MTPEQLNALASLLGIKAPALDALHAILIHQHDPVEAALAHHCAPDLVRSLTEQLRDADRLIRPAYVIHGPAEFRVMVGHNSTGRMPGALKLKIGQVVRLVAQSSERGIPVRITGLPATRHDYYHGTVIEGQARFQAGNGARFSEDQVA